MRKETVIGFCRPSWRIAQEDFGLTILPTIFEQRSQSTEVKVRITIEEIEEGGQHEENKKDEKDVREVNQTNNTIKQE